MKIVSDDLATLLRMEPFGWEGVKRMIRAGELLNKKADELKRTERGALKDWLDKRGLSKTKAHRARYIADHADMLAEHEPESVNAAIRQINGQNVDKMSELEKWSRQLERLLSMAPDGAAVERKGDKVTVNTAAKPRQTDIWAEMSQFRHAVQTVLPASDDKVATLSQIFGGNSYDVTITDLGNDQYGVKRDGAMGANRDTVSFDMTFTINEWASNE